MTKFDSIILFVNLQVPRTSYDYKRADNLYQYALFLILSLFFCEGKQLSPDTLCESGTPDWIICIAVIILAIHLWLIS